MKLYFDDPSIDYQVQRTVAKAPYGCCDVGEVFAIAARITPGDYDSWYREWFAAGDSNRTLAEKEAASGHHESARQAYLRASEYYRSAYFFCRRDIHGAPLLDGCRRSRDMFRAALPLLPYPAEAVQIPYEDVQLQGYIVRPRTGEGGPTLLVPAGYDSRRSRSSIRSGHRKRAHAASRSWRSRAPVRARCSTRATSSSAPTSRRWSGR